MKKILIVIDQPGWVFHRHALEIQNRLKEYHIDIAHRKQNIARLSDGYDVVYIMDPIPLRSFPPPEKTIMGLRCQFLYEEHPMGAKGLYENGWPGRCTSIQDKCSIFHVVNTNQYDVFRSYVTDKPLMIARHGVNIDIFNKDFFVKTEHENLHVSVAGRPSSNKGFETVNEVCKRNNYCLVSAHYGRGRVPFEQMPAVYAQADVHVCFSKSEGLSNPLMEAGAMELAPISTRTGASQEMIEQRESGLLIERNIEALEDALETMKDRSQRLKMAQRYYQEIHDNWTWDRRIEDFRKMFEQI